MFFYEKCMTNCREVICYRTYCYLLMSRKAWKIDYLTPKSHMGINIQINKIIFQSLLKIELNLKNHFLETLEILIAVAIFRNTYCCCCLRTKIKYNANKSLFVSLTLLSLNLTRDLKGYDNGC